MGAALGALGGPLGGLFALGAGILLQYLFPQKIEGPRQEDTRVSTAKYGDPIGRVLGTARIAGNYVWLKGNKIKETKHKHRQGKGGPIVTEYAYTSTSAAVFDYDGPAEGIIRIWLDDELVYDNSKDAKDQWLAQTGKGFGTAKGVQFTFYLGTDTQKPDSRIVADKGADKCSGWRNLVYIVMANLDHSDIGIRLPNIEAEICKKISGVDPDGATEFAWESVKLTDPDNTSGISGIIGWFDKSLAFWTGGGSPRSIYWYNILTGSFISEAPITFDTYGIEGGPALVSDTLGYVWDRNGNLFTFNQSGGGGSGAGLYDHSSSTVNRTPWSIVRGGKLHAFIGGKIDSIDLSTFTSTITDTNIGSLTNAHQFTANQAGTRFYISNNFTVDVCDLGSATNPNYNLNSLYGTGLLAVLWPMESGGFVVRAANGFYRINDDGTLAKSWLFRGDTNYWQFAADVGPDSEGNIWYAWYESGTLTYYKMDGETLDELDSIEANVLGVVASQVPICYVEDKQAFLRLSSSHVYIDYKPLIKRGGIDVSSIITDLVKLEGIDVDVIGVDKYIKGYAVKGDVTWRGVIEDLCRVMGIDHCQIDGEYKFFNRDNNSEMTIGADHIGAKVLDSGFPQGGVSELLVDELDKPNALTLTYPSFNASYRQGSQRFDVPLDSTDSLSEMNVGTSVVLSDNQAAKVADVMLREARESPDSYEFTLPPYYSRLHPGVVVSIPLEGGVFQKVVIEEIEDDIVLKIKAHKRTIGYASDALGVETPDDTQSKITDATVYFIPMDVNMLRDSAEDDNNGFYMVAYWTGTMGPGGINVWRSLSAGDTYEPWATFVSYACVCSLTAELAEEVNPYTFHHTATMTFQNLSAVAVPDSVSLEEWADGNLACAVERSDGQWEIVLVHTITDNGNGTYTAEGLVRGFRGTENLTGLHPVGSRIVWLDLNYVARTTDGQVNVAEAFVALIVGLEFDNSGSIAFTNQAHSLWPYRPVGITGSRDTGATETLTVSWDRQTRYGGSWIDGTESIPLHETSEEYEVEYYSGATLLRTRTGITGSGRTDDYLLSEYQTDSATPGATVIPTITVKIYQISSELTINSGRGYVGEQTL